MQLTEQTENGKDYDVVIHHVIFTAYSELYREVHNCEPEGWSKNDHLEIPLNDFASYYRSQKLPYSDKLNSLIQRAIDMNGELLWIKR